MWKKQKVNQCDCDMFGLNGLAPAKHQHRPSERIGPQIMQKNVKKQTKQKKSIKKIIASSNSKPHTTQAKEKLKLQTKPPAKKEITKKIQKTPAPTMAKSQPKLPSCGTVKSVSTRVMLPMEPPKNIIRVQTRAIKQVAVPQQHIVQKQQLIINKPMIGGSEYFIGAQFQQHAKKAHNLDCNMSNPKAPDSLEVTPQTTTPEFARCSSLNQIASKDSHQQKDFKRAGTQAKIYDPERDHSARQNSCREESVKSEKAKSLRAPVTYKNFQDLRPKSIVSSGDRYSIVSEFSDVIETVQIRRGVDKSKQYSLDKLISIK